MEHHKLIGSFFRYCSIHRALLAVIGVTLLYACAKEPTNEFVKKPDDLLSKNKMISFLIDLHLAEAKMSHVKVKSPDSTEILFRNYEKYLFEEHQISDSAYYQSYRYYLAHMDQLDEIYSAVVDSLNVLNSREKTKASNTDIQ